VHVFSMHSFIYYRNLYGYENMVIFANYFFLIPANFCSNAVPISCALSVVA